MKLAENRSARSRSHGRRHACVMSRPAHGTHLRTLGIGTWWGYPNAMPLYEFRCRACGSTFTQQRPMSESGNAANCPQGHSDTVRLLTMAGFARKASESASAAKAGPKAGCCGGGCCG